METTSIRFAAAALLLAAAPAAHAQSRTTTLPVSANVVSAVSVSATPLNFGNVLPGESAVGTANITVTATRGLQYSVQLDAGLHRASGGRTLVTATGEVIPYGLYSDLSRSSPWGDRGATISGEAPGATGTGAPDIYTVYGSMTSQTGHPPGLYTDTVLVTVSY